MKTLPLLSKKNATFKFALVRNACLKCSSFTVIGFFLLIARFDTGLIKLTDH